MPRHSPNDAPPLSPLAAELAKARAKRRKSANPDERRSATQVAIAKAMDVAQATVSGWESGRDLPRLDRLPRVAEVYGVREVRLRSLWLASAAAAAAARAA